MRKQLFTTNVQMRCSTMQSNFIMVFGKRKITQVASEQIQGFHPLLNLGPLTSLLQGSPGRLAFLVFTSLKINNQLSQPHSTLNMFQKADDKKSNLILNLLSWVDFLKPKFCFFENVRGFLQFSLNAIQLSQYRVGGGIKMGGLKFLVYALLKMK